MPDITLTPANVIVTDIANTATAVVGTGTTVAQGDLVRLQANQLFLSECDNTVLEAEVDGMALSAGSVGQIVTYALPLATIEMGANSATVGQNLTLSNALGKYGPESDRVSTEFLTTIGTMNTATLLDFRPNSFGVAKP